jgi:hypothetical protein
MEKNMEKEFILKLPTLDMKATIDVALNQVMVLCITMMGLSLIKDTGKKIFLMGKEQLMRKEKLKNRHNGRKE